MTAPARTTQAPVSIKVGLPPTALEGRSAGLLAGASDIAALCRQGEDQAAVGAFEARGAAPNVAPAPAETQTVVPSAAWTIVSALSVQGLTHGI